MELSQHMYIKISTFHGGCTPINAYCQSCLPTCTWLLVFLVYLIETLCSRVRYMAFLLALAGGLTLLLDW